MHYGYVDLVDGRHIIARNISRTGILAKNVHCRTADEARTTFEGMKRNLAGGYDILDTHGSGFKYTQKEKQDAEFERADAAQGR